MNPLEGPHDESDRPTRRAPPPPALLEIARGHADPELAACPTPKYPFWVESVRGRDTAAPAAPRATLDSFALDPFAIDRRRRALRTLAAMVVAIAIVVAIAFAARSTGHAAPRAWW